MIRYSKLVRCVPLATAIALAAIVSTGEANIASAAIPRIKCAHVDEASPISDVVLAKCSGNTGGGAPNVPHSLWSQQTTIVWANGQTTTVKLKVSGFPDGTGCPAGWSEAKVSGKVIADTTGSTVVGNHVHALLCVNGSTVTNVPGTKMKI